MSTDNVENHIEFGKKMVQVACRLHVKMDDEGETPESLELLETTAQSAADLLGLDVDRVTASMKGFLETSDAPADEIIADMM